MNRGRLEQVGTGRELYDDPVTAFVASFVGEANAVPGVVRRVSGGVAQLDTPLGPLRGRNPRGLAVGADATLFSARLHRFDRALEEAAYDLGASHTQVFCQVLLPFLRPAILSAAALAFLSSFENYNTTTFAILSDRTLTTVLAGQVRQGTTPAVSALAVLTLAATVMILLVAELARRWSASRRHAGFATSVGSPSAAPALDAPDMPGLAAAER